MTYRGKDKKYQEQTLGKNSNALNQYASRLTQSGQDNGLEQAKQHAKKLSQLVALSWLTPGEIPVSNESTKKELEKAGKEIREALNRDDTEGIVAAIAKYTKSPYIEGNSPVDLFAIFGEDLCITTDWGTYRSEISEIYLGQQDLRWLIRFPYPPRPPQANEELCMLDSTKDQTYGQALYAWTQNGESDEIVAPFPYIPLSAGG